MSEPQTTAAPSEGMLANTTGTILLFGEPDRNGRVAGWCQYGEHAGYVSVDVSKLDDRELVLRSRKLAYYVFTPDFYEAAKLLIARALDSEPERTQSALLRLLGEEGADRFIEHMGLADPLPDFGEVENHPASQGVMPSDQ